MPPHSAESGAWMTPVRLPAAKLPPKRRRVVGSAAPALTASVTLPDELVVFEIVSRMSVRSACRLKLVSKHWRELISGRAFADLHRCEPAMVISEAGGGMRVVDMDGHTVRRVEGVGGSETLCASGDDLVCVADGLFGDAARVVDPSAGEVVLTCPIPDADEHDGGGWRGAAFGFGRTAASGAHKVVCLTSDHTSLVLTVEGDGGGWRRTRSPPPAEVIFFYDGRSSVCVHFLVMSKLGSYSLLCFNLESEEWKVIAGPPLDKGDWRLKMNVVGRVRLAELDNTLCMVQTKVSMITDPHANVWRLHDNGVWVKAYAFGMPPSTSLCMPLRVTRDGGKLLFCCVHESRQALLLQAYDPRTGRCTHMMKIPDIHGPTVVGLCRLDLMRFSSAKIS